MGEDRNLKLGLASRMLLASLALLLPLVVFVLILVHDRNTRIDAARNEIAGIGYLVELRSLLEFVPMHAAAHQLAQDGNPPAMNHDGHTGHGGTAVTDHVRMAVSNINTTLERLRDLIETDGDRFGIRAPLAELEAIWKTIDHSRHNAIAMASMNQADAIQKQTLELFRHIGNAAHLEFEGSLETSHLARLVVHELPFMIARLSSARAHAADMASRDDPLALSDIRALSADDWSLSTFHENLFYGYSIAADGNPELTKALDAHFKAFDRDTSAFHAMISQGDILGMPERVFALGTTSIAATLALYDAIVPELLEILDTRLEELQRTKWIAIYAVIATSLVAAIAGWFLVSSITRPLQVEVEERRRAESRLRNMAAIVEQSNDAILTLTESGVVTSWNDGCERLYGYSADEIVGRSISCVAPEGYESETPSLMRRCLAGEKLAPHETVRMRQDGSLFDVSLRFSIVLDEASQTRNVAVIARDISLRKKAEAELIEKEQMLEARVRQLHVTQEQLRKHRDELEDLVRERTEEVQDKAVQLEAALRKEQELSALQRKFVSVASHEFRTPLAIIDGAAQRIARRGADIEPDDLAARIARIRGAVSRMLGLIESTLSASRLDAGQLGLKVGSLDIAHLVTLVCERHEEVLGSPPIRLDLASLPSEIEGDTNLLDQVFTNLVSNAVKYARHDPEISVSAEMTGPDWIAVRVRDNGVGIPQDEMEHLFGRFFRASTSEGIPGTGIGLSLVNEFVAMHGGRIEVESEVGVGSRFTVHLPVQQPANIENDNPGDPDIAAA